MNKSYKYVLVSIALLLTAGIGANARRAGQNTVEQDSIKKVNLDFQAPDNSIIDEVVWVVGDEPILKSEVEVYRMQAESEGRRFGGNPDFRIPESIAVQKLFLHQAAIDSIEVTETEISQMVEEQINYMINAVGSKEKLEDYRKMSVSQLRLEMHDDLKNSQLVQKMKQKLVEDIQVTPSDVRSYFRNLPEDSIPFVPTEVEVEIITRQPRVSQEEINRVKDELRNYTERVTNGSSSFATLARFYSEDPVSARQGGELGYMGRGTLDPAFAAVAFNLTDPKKISKIVESEFGYHIIQLVDKRGDKINVRHILKKPVVSAEAIETATHRLDSIADKLRSDDFVINNVKLSFEDAATFLSDDKDTRNNRGIMVNIIQNTRTSRFSMKDLPTEVARAVEGLKVGDISKAFTMVNSKGKTQVAIIKLKNRIEGHKATITEDFQVMKDVVLAKAREKTLHDWVVKKIKSTYVRMKDRYKNGDYEYEGWVK